MKIMSAIPTSPMDSFDASSPPIEKPKADFIRAILPNDTQSNLLDKNSEGEVKQGLGRVLAKIVGHRDFTRRRKQIENYKKVLGQVGPVGKKLDKSA